MNITALANALPRLKTRIQLAGFVVVAAVLVATMRAQSPEYLQTEITGGAIGVLFIVFGQVFASLADFPEQHRARLIVTLFVLFICFVLALMSLMIYSLPQKLIPKSQATE